LSLVKSNNIKTVAICGISTGIYGYPVSKAAHVALKTVREWLEIEENLNSIDRIVFVSFNLTEKDVYDNYIPIYFPLEEIKEDDNLSIKYEEQKETNNNNNNTESQEIKKNNGEPHTDNNNQMVLDSETKTNEIKVENSDTKTNDNNQMVIDSETKTTENKVENSYSKTNDNSEPHTDNNNQMVLDSETKTNEIKVENSDTKINDNNQMVIDSETKTIEIKDETKTEKSDHVNTESKLVDHLLETVKKKKKTNLMSKWKLLSIHHTIQMILKLVLILTKKK